jgi:hypothetical protein
MTDLLIVLQTHSVSNANGKTDRFCGEPKAIVSMKCIASLIKSIKWCRQQDASIHISLKIVDDHSEESFIEFLKKTAETADFPCELLHTETRGIMPSILKTYQVGREHGQDLVYFAQDDYLYYETAIWEMIDAYYQFTALAGYNVCIFPYDDPFRYSLTNYSYRVVLGAKRHWRNAYHTACCFMMSYATLTENWDLFEAMGTAKYNEFCEDVSINRLFQNFQEFPHRDITHLLFTPIPSLALHMGTESQRDPYINWKELWDKFPIHEIPPPLIKLTHV